MTKAPSVMDFARIVEGRIRALSIAHALLAESRWEGANLDQVIREELAPYRVGDAERFSISGPQVFLKPATAQAFAMVVHELATNAAKYGALSDGKGKVTAAWEWRRGVLRFEWQESEGPPVRPAETDGYGSKVIAASARQLGGTTKFDWQPTGLRFAMIMRIGDASIGQDSIGDLEDEGDFEPSARTTALPAGGQILLVEDEAFVAMMMRDLIAEIGFHVVGPCGTITDALEHLDRHALVGAVLDVNLAGEKIYPLAEQLSGRGIPFVFVTGYAADAIDGRFAGVPVLQKPVDGAALRRALNLADKQLC
jgi:two-component sensor histidine kinase/CheY-like chemotaxis protein